MKKIAACLGLILVAPVGLYRHHRQGRFQVPRLKQHGLEAGANQSCMKRLRQRAGLQSNGCDRQLRVRRKPIGASGWLAAFASTAKPRAGRNSCRPFSATNFRFSPRYAEMTPLNDDGLIHDENGPIAANRPQFMAATGP